MPGGPEGAERGWQRRRRATLGRGRPLGGGAARREGPLRMPGGGTHYGQKEGPGQSERHRPGRQPCSGSRITHSQEVRTSGLWPRVQSPGRAAARVPPRSCAHWLRLGRACALRACSNVSRAVWTPPSGLTPLPSPTAATLQPEPATCRRDPRGHPA